MTVQLCVQTGTPIQLVTLKVVELLGGSDSKVIMRHCAPGEGKGGRQGCQGWRKSAAWRDECGWAALEGLLSHTLRLLCRSASTINIQTATHSHCDFGMRTPVFTCCASKVKDLMKEEDVTQLCLAHPFSHSSLCASPIPRQEAPLVEDAWTLGRLDAWTLGRLDAWTLGRSDAWISRDGLLIRWQTVLAQASIGSNSAALFEK